MKRLSLAIALAAAFPAMVSADSITPIALRVVVNRVARADRRLPVRVLVSADAGALDARHGPLRVQVKLTASECGGDYSQTPGRVLLDRQLVPQPSPGRAYAGAVLGTALPPGYGSYIVCAYLDDDYEQLATSTGELTVTVSRPCTLAARAYDRTPRRSRRRRAALRRTALRACGPGVAL